VTTLLPDIKIVRAQRPKHWAQALPKPSDRVCSIDNSLLTPMLDVILVRLRVHTTVCEGADDFDRVTQSSLAKRSVRDSVAIRNDKPIASEMSNDLVFSAPGAPGAFHSAHHFAINNSTLNDVQGNYVRRRFVACVYQYQSLLRTDTCPELLRGSQDR
jgi:hypothetical protein